MPERPDVEAKLWDLQRHGQVTITCPYREHAESGERPYVVTIARQGNPALGIKTIGTGTDIVQAIEDGAREIASQLKDASRKAKKSCEDDRP